MPPSYNIPCGIRMTRRRRPFRVRILGAGQIFKGAIDTFRVYGCDVYFEGDDTGRKVMDLLVLAACTRIIPRAEFERYRLGALCFHPSLLPRHRGIDAVYWTVEQGDNITGATWFWLDEGIDTGPIATQAALPRPVPLGTSRGALYYGLLVPLGGRLLSELIPRLLRGERPAQPQDDAYATYEPPRPRAESVA
jgi:methionyl-tRNA formyltransferase